jgi:hypothetical protein
MALASTRAENLGLEAIRRARATELVVDGDSETNMSMATSLLLSIIMDPCADVPSHGLLHGSHSAG